jgi:glycosyltransferase involved in cell wall biosynthesis
MKVSIVIPVYNVSKYIKRCLQSVVDQTYQDIECILVDDCGSDNSIELAQQFINDYHGAIEFKLIRHNQNKGQSAARNTALRYIKGDYVFFLDSDDEIPSDSIESLMKLAIKYPKADFIQGNLLDETGSISKFGWRSTLPEYCDDTNYLEKIILSVVVFSAWNKAIKTSFLTKNNLYFPEGIIHEDLYWIFFVAKYAKAVGFVNKGTYIYCINDNSTITNLSQEARIKRYSSRLIASEAFCTELDKEHHASKHQRLFVAGNLTCAMIEVAALHSFKHWRTFWCHVWKLYTSHKRLTIWQHILFIFLMPPLCFPIGIKGWYWRVQHHIVNNI